MKENEKPPRIVVAWIALSNRLLTVELCFSALLLIGLLVTIMTNVITRYVGMPIYWVNELAIFILAWLAFVGTSSMARLRLDFAITFLSDAAPERTARALKIGSIAVTIAFGLAVASMSWLWLDPAGLFSAGFDIRAFSRETGNFLYSETTVALNWPRWIVMIVVPIFAVTLTFHAVANLFEELYRLRRTATAPFEEETV